MKEKLEKLIRKWKRQRKQKVEEIKSVSEILNSCDNPPECLPEPVGLEESQLWNSAQCERLSMCINELKILLQELK